MNLISLIKSKTRRKILKFFFSNEEKKYYLRELEKILSLSVGNIRRELIYLEKLGLFKKEQMGNLTYYYLNKNSPFFEVIKSIVLKTIDIKNYKGSEGKVKNTNLMVIKKDDLDILFSKINELENILETFLQKDSEFEDFLNLGVVLNDRKEVLIVRRRKQERGKKGAVLTWAFPGGAQRLNESRKECVVREVQDETGYRVEPIREISFRLHPQFPKFIVYHLCRLVSKKPVSKPKEFYEIADIKWVKPKEIKKFFTTNLDPKVGLELGV